MSKSKNIFWFIAALVIAEMSTFATPIPDPIADYLTMQVPDRSEYIGTPDIIYRVKIDVDGDGTDEVFVGSWYKYSGSKGAVYWSGYKEVEGGGYERITSATSDICIPSFETVFAGNLVEASKQGLAYASDTIVDNENDANITGVKSFHYLTIMNRALADEDRGALNLSTPADKVIYDRYFGPNRHTRSATSYETFTARQLQQMGYTIPNWEP